MMTTSWAWTNSRQVTGNVGDSPGGTTSAPSGTSRQYGQYFRCTAIRLLAHCVSSPVSTESLYYNQIKHLLPPSLPHFSKPLPPRHSCKDRMTFYRAVPAL